MIPPFTMLEEYFGRKLGEDERVTIRAAGSDG